VANNYRQNDWQPYLYHTTDHGQKWKRLAKNVTGFCLSVVQDAVEPNLIFLGTDQGLYMSVDYGETWTKWSSEGFPSVPVQDMKIQQRDGDLVIATFGRAIWVLDDIRPLRELARTKAELLKSDFKVFPAPDAVMAEMRSFSGPRFAAGATYAGENKWPSARVAVWVKPVPAGVKDQKKKKEEEKDKDKDKGGKGKPGDSGKPKKDKATITIFSAKGDTIRRFKTELDSCFNYIGWGFDTKGVRFPSNSEPDKEQLEPGGGPRALPGRYKMVVVYGEFKDSTEFNVLADPRLDETPADQKANIDAVRDFQNQVIARTAKAYDRLKEAEKTIKLVEDQLTNVPDSTKKDVVKLTKTLRDSISALKEVFFQQKESKGIQRDPENLNAYLYRAISYIEACKGAPNAHAMIAVNEAKRRANLAIDRINTLFDKPWTEFKTKSETIKYSLFKSFDKL
jgi:hypothetical protein